MRTHVESLRPGRSFSKSSGFSGPKYLFLKTTKKKLFGKKINTHVCVDQA